MSESKAVAPAAPSTDLVQLMGASSSPALQILLNDALYVRCKDVAGRMAQAEGVTPKHLVGKPAACFAVVQMALIWKLAPQMVAGATYSTPGGNIGYEGKLCHAIIENSGRIDGQIKAEYYGPWEKIEGRFRMVTKKNKNNYDVTVPEQLWKPEDEEGVGVRVIAQVKGEVEPREMCFDLKSAHPRNSTIWVTRTKQQLWYTAIRAFGNMAVPGIFMGVPFDGGDGGYGDGMIDVTPQGESPVTRERPVRQQRAQAKARAEEMDQQFKSTAGTAAPPQETVIEETPAGSDNQEPDQAEDGENQGVDDAYADAYAQPDEAQQASDEPEEQERDQDGQDSAYEEAEEQAPPPPPPPPPPPAPPKQQQRTAAPAATGRVKPPMTEDEIRAFVREVEGGILKVASVSAMEVFKEKMRERMNQLRNSPARIVKKAGEDDFDRYKHLLDIITTKEKKLLKEEAQG